MIIINTLKSADAEVTCGIDSVGFLFDTGSITGPDVTIGCTANTNDCACRLLGTVVSTNVIQTNVCLNVMIDALLDFEMEGIDYGGCNLFNLE